MAVELLLDSPLAVIDGPPASGKSFVAALHVASLLPSSHSLTSTDGHSLAKSIRVLVLTRTARAADAFIRRLHQARELFPAAAGARVGRLVGASQPRDVPSEACEQVNRPIISADRVLLSTAEDDWLRGFIERRTDFEAKRLSDEIFFRHSEEYRVERAAREVGADLDKFVQLVVRRGATERGDRPPPDAVSQILKNFQKCFVHKTEIGGKRDTPPPEPIQQTKLLNLDAFSVVVTTSDDASLNFASLKSFQPSVVVVDQASLIPEAEILPLLLGGGDSQQSSVRQLALFGDTSEMPLIATTHLPHEIKMRKNKSLFHRLSGKPKLYRRLTAQRRPRAASVSSRPSDSECRVFHSSAAAIERAGVSPCTVLSRHCIEIVEGGAASRYKRALSHVANLLSGRLDESSSVPVVILCDTPSELEGFARALAAASSIRAADVQVDLIMDYRGKEAPGDVVVLISEHLTADNCRDDPHWDMAVVSAAIAMETTTYFASAEMGICKRWSLFCRKLHELGAVTGSPTWE